MPLLSEEDRKTLEDRFAETLDEDVKILLFTESEARSLLTIPGQAANGAGAEYAKVTRELLTELAATSPKLTLEVLDVHGDGADEAKRLQIEHIPAIVLDRGGPSRHSREGGNPAPDFPDDGRVRFYGAPVGNEFPTILTGIESLSKSTPMLRDGVATAVRERIDQQVHLRVFVTPT